MTTSRILAAISVLIAVGALSWVIRSHRQWADDKKSNRLMYAVLIFLVGMIVGPLPRALAVQNEALLIGASMFSLAATLIASVIYLRARRSSGGAPGSGP